MTHGPYMMARSGRRFYFANPDPAEIDLADIAFALRHLHRFTGHIGAYDVATHSVHVLQCAIGLGADFRTQRAALLHDAHEAFVGDISSPLKAAIGPAFEEIDRRAADAIAIRFGLVEFDHEIVHRADRMVTHAEARHFMGDKADGWATDPWLAWLPDPPCAFPFACKILGVR